MVVGDVDDTGSPAVVEATKEIVLARGGKVGGGMEAVFVPADVGGLVVIGAGIRTVRHRVVHRRLGHGVMVVGVIDVRWENELVIVVDGHGGVLPHQEAVAQLRAVGDLNASLEESRIRVQDDTDG